MNKSNFYLCALPQTAWMEGQGYGGVQIGQFASDALACERRMSKGVNLSTEHNRYAATCEQLEQAVLSSKRLRQVSDQTEFEELLKNDCIPMLMLPSDYITVLTALDEPGPDRLGASFFPPDMVPDYLEAVKQWASGQRPEERPTTAHLLFYKWAQLNGCGVVEVQSGYLEEGVSVELSSVQTAPSDAYLGRGDKVDQSILDILAANKNSFADSGNKENISNLLRKQIVEALRSGEPVTFGNQAQHDVIAEVLREFVFVPPDKVNRREIRIAYADGSEAEPFPILCLPRPPTDAASGGDPLRVALLSMRHTELDSQVDYYWLRNQEVSRTRTLAETDAYCFTETLSQLDEALTLGDLAIDMYQTGFEPAIIGLYRGVVHALLRLAERNHGPKLVLTPRFYRGENTWIGSVWA